MRCRLPSGFLSGEGGSARTLLVRRWSTDLFAALDALFRERESASLVLDEPDVYLHPDLQRKLMRLLLEVSPQVIVATHSQEMVMEAGTDALVWVDKSRRRSIQRIQIPDDARLTELSDSVGSAFNLGLARTLKARAVIFVEGEDDVMLRDIASRLGLRHLALGGALSMVPLGGITRLDRLESLAWLKESFLGETVRGFVLLDGDYRPAERVNVLLKQIRKYGLDGHVWSRKELESYLLHPSLLSRVTQAPKVRIQQLLEAGTEELEESLMTQMIDRYYKERATRSEDSKTTTKKALRDFKSLWGDPAKRIAALPPKELRHWLNDALQEEGFKTFRFRQLSRSIESREVPAEMKRVLRRVSALGQS